MSSKKDKKDKKKAKAKKTASVLDGRVCPKCSKGKAVRAKALKDA